MMITTTIKLLWATELVVIVKMMLIFSIHWTWITTTWNIVNKQEEIRAYPWFYRQITACRFLSKNFTSVLMPHDIIFLIFILTQVTLRSESTWAHKNSKGMILKGMKSDRRRAGNKICLVLTCLSVCVLNVIGCLLMHYFLRCLSVISTRIS